MWRSRNSDKQKTGASRLLPPSSRQLHHAKADRGEESSYFRERAREWAPVVHPRVAQPVEEKAPVDTSDLPSFLRHRALRTNAQKLFFRTNPAAVGRKKNS